VKRDDLIHDEVSGNKWRKMKLNIAMCQQLKKDALLTFGGAYSNHLLATAAACNLMGLGSIGLVRGDELNENSNKILSRCAELGMKLDFISREEYGMRNEKGYHESINAQYRGVYLVPEGGANYYGVVGCQQIMGEIKEDVDHVFISQGTTTTSCGVLMSINEDQQLHVVPALKGFDSISEMRTLLGKSGFESDMIDDALAKVIVHSESHFGGYGKYPVGLIKFIEQFYKDHQLKLDPIYTGKAMHCLLEELNDSKYNEKTIVFIHSGGLQGGKGIVNFEAK
jgi:1-aminocyclopropane-1-carboxylate deaminase